MTKAKKDDLVKKLLTYGLPVLIGGGAGTGAASIKIAVLQEQVKQLQEEKEILFKGKASKAELEKVDKRSENTAIMHAELRGKVESYH